MNEGIEKEIEREILGFLQEKLNQALNEGARDRVREALESWLAFTARKKPVADLLQRLEDFRKRIEVLAAVLEVELGPEGCVVKTVGDAQSTWRMLQRGTSWFDSANNLDEMVVGAILVEA